MLGLFTFGGVVAVTPVWMYFTTEYPALSTLSTETRFLLGLTLPALALLLLASWFGPSGGGS
jgi:hypothetical protein